MNVSTPVDWFGLEPMQWQGAPGRGFSMALWRMDCRSSQSARTQPIADAHLVCVDLAGHMEWACEAEDRSYRRAALPNTLSIARAGEVADVEWRDAHIEFAHFYLPTRGLAAEVGDVNSDGKHPDIELVDPMNARSPHGRWRGCAPADPRRDWKWRPWACDWLRH